MSQSSQAWRIATLALVLVAVGCGPGERPAERPDEAAPAADTARAGEGGATSEEAAAQAEPEAEAPEETVSDTALQQPGTVAPATEAEVRAVRSWVLLEFSRPLEEGDLEWLEANGFRVDSVMGDRRVRGWLERAEAGRTIANDPRIARVHTQMR
jgi:hypothetical protein